MAEYAILYLLLCNAIKQLGVAFTPALALAAIASLLYALSDEFHQRFVAGRTGSLRDVGIDSAGIIIMGLIIVISQSKRMSREGTPVS